MQKVSALCAEFQKVTLAEDTFWQNKSLYARILYFCGKVQYVSETINRELTEDLLSIECLA